MGNVCIMIQGYPRRGRDFGHRLGALLAAMSLVALTSCAKPAEEVLYDTHIHLFTADTAHFPTNTAGAKEGPQNLLKRVHEQPDDANHVLDLWKANGIAGGVAVQYHSVYKTDNRYLLAAHAAHADKFAAVAILDPRDPDTPRKLAQMAAHDHIVGLRITGKADANGQFPWIDSTETQATWNAVSKLHLIMVIIALPPVMSDTEMASISAMASRYPDVPIVLDHLAWAMGPAPDFGIDRLAAVMKPHPNVYYKLTTINFDLLAKAGIDPAAYVDRAVAILGADRLMWGSDFGNTTSPYSEMVARMRSAARHLDQAQRRAVFYETGHRLFTGVTAP